MFMSSREHLSPPGFAERNCSLVRYKLPGIPHCYVFCHLSGSASVEQRAELIQFFLVQAHCLAHAATGDSEAFMLAHSGSSVRKRESWHLHVFIVQSRWQKAWVYTILAAKNIAQATWGSVKRIFLGSQAPNPSVKGTSCGKPQAAPYVER
jgi:hypothetical protein